MSSRTCDFISTHADVERYPRQALPRLLGLTLASLMLAYFLSAPPWSVTTAHAQAPLVAQEAPRAGAGSDVASQNLKSLPPLPVGMRVAGAPGPARAVRPRAILTQGQETNSVAFSPDGRTLAVACSYNKGRGDRDPFDVALWDVASRSRLATLRAHPYMARSVVFSPDGLTLASGGDGRTLVLWDVATCTVKAKSDPVLRGNRWGIEIGTLTFNPGGRTLLALTHDEVASLWEVPEGREIPPVALPDEFFVVEAATFNAAGHLLLLLERPFWKVDDRTFNRRRAAGHVPTKEEWDASVRQRDLDDLMLWDATSKADRRLWSLQTKHRARNASFSASGMHLARFPCQNDSGSDSNLIILMDAKTGRERTLSDRATVHHVEFSRDGKLMVSCGSMKYPHDEIPRVGLVTIWDVETGRERASFVADGGYVAYISFSPDGKILASVGSDNAVKLWNVAEILAQ